MNDNGFANEFLHAYLADVEQGRARSAEDYAAMFPGREREIAEQLAELRGEQPEADLPEIPGVELQAEIGRGGQGIVYRGRQSYLDRDVAVKLLRDVPFADDWVARFEREAKTLAGLTHPNIVGCHAGGTTPAGQCYLVMEYVDGPSLRKWISDHGPLDVPTALGLVRDLAGALAHAHAAGIIHRDVKPENVLLDPRPSGDLPFTPKLADLGLARRAGVPSDVSLMTPAGMVLGTPSTMAPEQLGDPENVDHRADIYGLGCVLYHALTGQPAFATRDISVAIHTKLSGKVPDARAKRREIPPGVARLAASMMAKRREDRPRSHDEVVTRCTELLEPGTRRRRWIEVFAVVWLAVFVWIFATSSPSSPPVVLAQSAAVSEGERVELRARVNDPAGGEPTYLWKQVKGLPVELHEATSPSASFVAPVGFESITLLFELVVTSGGRTARDEARVLVRGDPSLAALGPDQVRALFQRDYGSRVAGWQREGGQWGASETHGGAVGVCRDGRGRLTRRLPRGSWTLAGALEPIRQFDPKTAEEREIGAAGVHLGFGCGNGLVLELRPAGEGRYAARVRHVVSEDWTTVEAIGETEPGAWAQNRPLRFTVTWDGKQMATAVDGEQIAAVAPRTWGTAYPPSRLTLFVDSGGGCFCELSLTGRE